MLEAGSYLAVQETTPTPAACFIPLNELIDVMERSEESVFAHEYGSWMIHGDEKQYIAAYMTSLVATLTQEEFARIALPLIRRECRR